MSDVDDLAGLRRSALDVALTWGPERATPEPDRVSARHPGVAMEEIERALVEAHGVMAAAQELAPAVKGYGPASTSRDEIRRSHPWVTEEQLERAISQGLYADWRDTGR